MGKLSGGRGINFEKIAQISITLLSLYVLSAVFSFIQGFTMTGIAQKITYKLRNDMASKINKLPMNYFDKRTNGEVLSIITNDIDTLSMNLNQSITQIITAICTIIGILIMMFSISWQMTLISLIILPIAGIVVKKIVGKSQKYFSKQQDYLGHVNGQVEEIYGGLTVVKAFNAEDKVTGDFEAANNELYRAGWKAQFLSGLMHPVMNFISNIGYVGVAVAGGYLAINGTITVGNIQSFIQYNRQFVQPINQIAQISSMLQSMAAAAERIFEFLEEPEEDIIGFFLTNNVNNVINTIKSRCEIINMFYSEAALTINTLDNENNYKYFEVAKEYLRQIEVEKKDGIMYNNSDLLNIFSEREDIKIVFQILVLIFEELLKYKYNLDNQFAILNLDFLVNLDEKVILKKINLLNEFLDNLNSNANLELLLDRFVIEMS